MLPPAETYDAMYRDFRWIIPDRYNMAADVCDRWADQAPDRLAIIDMTGMQRRDITFGELHRMANRLANHLASLGVQRGSRVGVLRPQSTWTAAAHIAIWKLGAISMPLFPLFGEDALTVRVADAEAIAIVTDSQGAEKIASLRTRPASLMHVVVPENAPLETQPPDFGTADTAAEDPAVLIYTSGTTGDPKGALHAHRVLPGHLPGVEMSHDLFPQSGDLIWTPADWAWIGGLFDVLMPALHHGVPVVASRFAKFTGTATKELIESIGIRNVFFPPTALRMLRAEDVRIEGLRSIASGGEPLGAEMLDWAHKMLGVTINEFYGQTECNMVLSSCAALFPPVPGAIGRAVSGHEVAVVDAEGRPVSGAEGDIAVRRGSPAMMQEYWRKPDATADKFRGDWLVTGDRGIEEDGVFRFVGRSDDVITSSGYRIGPAEVEDCLLKHPAVASVGVVGKPDPDRTEIIKAYIVLRSGVQSDDNLVAELQTHVKTRLAAHEYPREIAFIDALPMTVTGKIIRKELRRLAVAEGGATHDDT